MFSKGLGQGKYIFRRREIVSRFPVNGDGDIRCWYWTDIEHRMNDEEHVI